MNNTDSVQINNRTQLIVALEEWVEKNANSDVTRRRIAAVVRHLNHTGLPMAVAIENAPASIKSRINWAAYKHYE